MWTSRPKGVTATVDFDDSVWALVTLKKIKWRK